MLQVYENSPTGLFRGAHDYSSEGFSKWVLSMDQTGFCSSSYLAIAAKPSMLLRQSTGSTCNNTCSTGSCRCLNLISPVALFRRGLPKSVIVHSDRGSQYCSTDFRELIAKHELKQNMSRKGNCWDDACAKSFFRSLKVEAINDEQTMNRQTMRQTVFEYIEVDYN